MSCSLAASIGRRAAAAIRYELELLALNCGANAWTGATSMGSIGLPLGAATMFATTGSLGRTDVGWLDRQIPVLPTSQFRFYGISSDLTSPVPEPGTLSLGVFSLLVALWGRMRAGERMRSRPCEATNNRLVS